VANLSKTLHINFYQNRSSIVEVMIIFFGFYDLQCSIFILIFLSGISLSDPTLYSSQLPLACHRLYFRIQLCQNSISSPSSWRC